MMKGWRTVAINAGIAAATGALQYLAGVNWVEHVGEFWAITIVTAINGYLRYITTTPIGQNA